MNKQVNMQAKSYWHKMVAALLLAAALTALPVLAANLPGPLSNLVARPAYACPLGGNCG